MSIRVIVADDHKIVRDGLCALLAQQPDMEVVAEAADGHTAVQLARNLSPDVVIMDITMPDLNGIEATQQIVAQAPGVKVIALSIHADRQFVAGMLTAGASGYLLKNCAFEELRQAIRTVVAGQLYLSPGIAGIVVKDYTQYMVASGVREVAVLTVREREVLQLMAEGKTTNQIASRLNVSVKTVEAHRHNIMEKLNLYNVAALTKYAIRAGLTSLENGSDHPSGQ